MFLDADGKHYHVTRYTVSPPAPAIIEPDKAAGETEKGDAHVPDGARPGDPPVVDVGDHRRLQRLGLS